MSKRRKGDEEPASGGTMLQALQRAQEVVGDSLDDAHKALASVRARERMREVVDDDALWDAWFDRQWDVYAIQSMGLAFGVAEGEMARAAVLRMVQEQRGEP